MARLVEEGRRALAEQRGAEAVDGREAIRCTRGVLSGSYPDGHLESLRDDWPVLLNATVLICGCGHSGTSLLASMFAAHPETWVPLGETEIFLGDEASAAAGLEALVAEADAHGRRFVVEKTPRHIRRLELVRRLAPGTRIVASVRDGRDVTASIKTRLGMAEPGVNRWIVDTGIVARERASGDLLAYRHEDMVDDPRAVLDQICTFAGIPFREEMLTFHAQERLWFGQEEVRRGTGVGQTEHDALRNWQVNQPIFDNRGRWRSELTDAEIGPLLTGEGGALMREFGYLD